MEALFQMSVPRVGGLADVGSITGYDPREVCWAIDGQGREWVRKRESGIGCNGMLAEAVGWLLCRRLGAPVADAGAYLVADEESWLSARVPDVTHWDPGQWTNVSNAAEIGALLTVDVIILNDDRHQGNILLQAAPSRLKLRAVGIDTANAWIGDPDGFAAAADAIPGVDKLAPGLPIDLIEPVAIETAAAAADLGTEDLRQMVLEACEIARESKTGVLLDALEKRCHLAPQLVMRYLPTVGARP